MMRKDPAHALFTPVPYSCYDIDGKLVIDNGFALRDIVVGEILTVKFTGYALRPIAKGVPLFSGGQVELKYEP